MSDDLFGAAINDIANGPKLTGYGMLTKELMRRLADNGLTLAQLSGPKMMNRSISTLQAHARKFDLSFPDYVPAKLRPKKERPTKKTAGRTETSIPGLTIRWGGRAAKIYAHVLHKQSGKIAISFDGTWLPFGKREFVRRLDASDIAKVDWDRPADDLGAPGELVAIVGAVKSQVLA